MTTPHESAPPTPGGADPRPVPSDPRTPEIRTELARIERRWSELSLERALAALPSVRETLDQLTHDAATPPVPDLGPATALHQLKVLVWETCTARAEAESEGRADGIPDPLDLLTTLRRALP